MANRHNWPHDTHPSTLDAFDTVDAAMFTGNPGETPEKFKFFQEMVERWSIRMTQVKLSLEETEIE